jgi:hypothetical protein
MHHFFSLLFLKYFSIVYSIILFSIILIYLGPYLGVPVYTLLTLSIWFIVFPSIDKNATL